MTKRTDPPKKARGTRTEHDRSTASRIRSDPNAHRTREQLLHERVLAPLVGGDQLAGEGDRLVPCAEDRGDFALLSERIKVLRRQYSDYNRD